MLLALRVNIQTYPLSHLWEITNLLLTSLAGEQQQVRVAGDLQVQKRVPTTCPSQLELREIVVVEDKGFA